MFMNVQCKCIMGKSDFVKHYNSNQFYKVLRMLRCYKHVYSLYLVPVFELYVKINKAINQIF